MEVIKNASNGSSYDCDFKERIRVGGLRQDFVDIKESILGCLGAFRETINLRLIGCSANCSNVDGLVLWKLLSTFKQALERIQLLVVRDFLEI